MVEPSKQRLGFITKAKAGSAKQCLRQCWQRVFNIPRVQCQAGQWTVARGWLYAGRMFCARTRSLCLRVLPRVIVISVFNGLSFVIRWVTPCHNMTADDMGWCDHWVTAISDHIRQVWVSSIIRSSVIMFWNFLFQNFYRALKLDCISFIDGEAWHIQCNSVLFSISS